MNSGWRERPRGLGQEIGAEVRSGVRVGARMELELGSPLDYSDPH